MSTKIMLEVARHSTAKGNAKLVLLLLASYAHTDGTHAEMSLSTIAREAGISRRQVNTIVHFLAETGHVRLESSAGAHGTNRYAVQRPWLKEGNHFPSATTSPGAIIAPLVQPLPTNDKENKDLKKQLGEMTALGQSLPHEGGQSLPHDLTDKPAVQLHPRAHATLHWLGYDPQSEAYSRLTGGVIPPEVDRVDDDTAGQAQARTPVRPRPLPFDTTKWYLGEPCQADPTHRFADTGQTVRVIKGDACRACTLAAKKAARQPPP